MHSGALRCKQVHLGVEPELFADDDGRLIQFSSLEMRQCHLRRPHEYKTTRGTQWHSVALSGTQWHSVVRFGVGQGKLHLAASKVLRGHLRSSEVIRVTHRASRGNSTCRSRSRSGCVRWSISSPALRSSLWLSRTSIACESLPASSHAPAAPLSSSRASRRELACGEKAP